MIALLRTEFYKAARRTRTLVIGLLLVGLPTLIVVAINTRGKGGRRDGDGEGLFRLAQQSGYLVPAAVLSVMSGFLLVVIAGMFAGDSVAGDAGSGNLRYLLMRPVPRGRILLAKAIVAGVFIWAATILVVLAGLVAGLVLFGAHSVSVPGFFSIAGGGSFTSFELGRNVLLLRIALATGYVAFGLTALLAMGTFFSVVTDTSAGAIGGTIGVYIVSEILDAIPQFGRLRYGFPTHYLDAWQSMFSGNTYSHDMFTGIIVQVGYLVVFGAAAFWWFRRKDIRS